ncbi:lytic transglycosylase domain-containing protein [Persephonella sp.]
MTKYRILLILSFLMVFSTAFSFEECLEYFKQEKYLKAKKCFSRIQEKDPLYPYAVYYRVLINTILEENISGLLAEMEKYRNSAVYSYTFLYLSSVKRFSDINEGYRYFKKVNPDAVHPDDLPFYRYLNVYYLCSTGNKDCFYEEAKFLEEYGYERFYGFPMFVKEADNLHQEVVYRAVEKMIRKRMYSRALYSLQFVDESDRKKFLQTVLYARLRKFDRAVGMLTTLPEGFRAQASYTIIRLNPKYSVQSAVFQILKETGRKKLIIRASDYMMKRAFYLGKMRDFEYYSGFIPETSPFYADVVWYRFLSKYVKGKKVKAGKYLEKNTRFFKDKDMVYYWLYLSFKDRFTSKADHYLKKASAVEKNSFYAVRAREKLGINLFRQKNYRKKTVSDLRLMMIKRLKELNYRWAYIEAKFYLKTGDKQLLSQVFPEATAVCYTNRKFISRKSHPKPFRKITDDNFVYAVMRRESFFDAYAVSFANAVGLMQIIPPTGKWIAQKKGDRNFDVTHLFIPEKNIDYGMWYINYLNKIFKGNIFYVMASYNAGHGNIRKVLKKHRIQNIEEFIELIPFRETRHYVKYVYTNYRAYQQIYGKR